MASDFRPSFLEGIYAFITFRRVPVSKCVMLTPHTPHLYTWPRFRGVFVGYIEILRYTSDLPLGGLGSSFLSEARLQSCSSCSSCFPYSFVSCLYTLTCLLSSPVSSLHLNIYPKTLLSVFISS